jgi:ubiquinone/menaquinone biosynthesis C-methylase UbiE
MNDTIRYHLDELKIAQNPGNPSHSMPVFSGNERIVLDIGCGIGQTLAAANLPDTMLALGIDIDFESLAYGRQKFRNISFVCACAESLPFKSQSVDHAFSRVSIPFTNIPQSVASISRVLCEKGGLWLELHPPGMIFEHIGKVIARRSIREFVYMTYVLINGIIFHMSGAMFRFPYKRRRYESFQTMKRMRRILMSLDFENITFAGNHSLKVTAVKSGTGKKSL